MPSIVQAMRDAAYVTCDGTGWTSASSVEPRIGGHGVWLHAAVTPDASAYPGRVRKKGVDADR